MVRVLFLCSGNSCRSQMAEGFARALRPGVVEAASAGVAARPVDPLAVRVMAEAGVDISGQRSKAVAAVVGGDFDYVVTLCDEAARQCPAFSGAALVVRRPFPDPPELAAGLPEAEALEVYRRVRDRIRDYVAAMPGNLPPRGQNRVPPPVFGP